MTLAAGASIAPAEALEILRDEFEAAAGLAGGLVEHLVTIAGSSLRIRFAGPAAATILTRAFAHLPPGNERSVGLTLHVWDRSGGVPRPALAPNAGDGQMRSDGVGASFFRFDRGLRTLHQPATDTLSVLSPDATRAWFWAPDASVLPYWDHATPFRHLLSWWLADRGLQHVHSGAVGNEAGGVVLVGRGGSGKSTTALSSLRDERLLYAGDDYVALECASGEMTVHSLYSSGKLHRHDLSRLPHVAAALANRDRVDEKGVVYVAEAFPARCITRFPLRAIVLPHVVDAPTARVLPETPGAALAALAPSTLFQLHPPAQKSLSRMAAFVRDVPAFRLELGRDPGTIPVALLGLLNELS